MTFKKPEMDKTLKNGVNYDGNESPQPQVVGFCDLVGTDIAPVSKKTAVKSFSYIFVLLEGDVQKPKRFVTDFTWFNKWRD